MKLLFILLISISAINISWTRHIIGGDFSYEYKGPGKLINTKKFDFNLNVYRDCGTPILFNPNAAFGVYKFDQKRFEFISQLNVIHGLIKKIQQDSVSCFNNVPICVEETTYNFSLELPQINETYVIYYIQCCRNQSVLNIIDPANIGATFYIEISPKAQLENNNSPKFIEMKSSFTCVQNLELDLSAYDSNNDSLSYEFCSPKRGGGPGGNTGTPPTVCNSPTPEPKSCPPPFIDVEFASTFGPDYPLGINTLILDNKTGKIRGANQVPLGQYLIGLCVKEYRKGIIIGSVFREIQINVVDCSLYIKKIIPKSDLYITSSNRPVNIDLLSNDSINGKFEVLVTISDPTNGKLVYSNLNGQGIFSPYNKFYGKEELKYTICPTNCENACVTSTVVFEISQPCADKTNLVLPNVIFPTGSSGDNKYFVVEALIKCPEAFGPNPTKLLVFNRWGDQVYRSDDYRNDWEGTNTQGQPLPEGTYYYLLDLGSVSAPVKGYVVIVR